MIWVEVWIDTSSNGQYFLIVRGYADGTCQIADPQEGGKLVKACSSYQAAQTWLNEDEYDLVEGRVLLSE